MDHKAVHQEQRARFQRNGNVAFRWKFALALCVYEAVALIILALVRIAHEFRLGDSFFMRTRNDLQTAVLGCAIRHSYPEAHKFARLDIDERGRLMSNRTRTFGMLHHQKHALANDRLAETERFNSIFHFWAEGHFVKDWILSMQGVPDSIGSLANHLRLRLRVLMRVGCELFLVQEQLDIARTLLKVVVFGLGRHFHLRNEGKRWNLLQVFGINELLDDFTGLLVHFGALVRVEEILENQESIFLELLNLLVGQHFALTLISLF